MATQLGACCLWAFSNSQLIVIQVSGNYDAHDPKVGQYLEVVRNIMQYFCEVEILRLSREDNSHADVLA